MAQLQLLKSGKNFQVYTDGTQKLIKLGGRFSYPAFGKKKLNKGEDGKADRENWGGVIMLPKATHKEAYDELVAICEEIRSKSMNDKTNKPGVIIEPQNFCYKDGDTKEDEAMHGHWLVTFSDSNRQPVIRRKNGEVMMDVSEIDGLFYGGCWGNVLLRPWYFNGKAKGDSKTYPKRISSGFTGAQFVKDGEPFGAGRIDDTDAWGSVDDDGLDDDDGL